MALAALTTAAVLAGIGGCDLEEPIDPLPIEIGSEEARVVIALAPFEMTIFDIDGNVVLETLTGDQEAYGAPSATVDDWGEVPTLLPGYDGYRANEAPWRRATRAAVQSASDNQIVLALDADGIAMTLDVSVEGPRVRVSVRAREDEAASDSGELNKSSIAFRLPEDEHFFGLGERFASVDHRGLSLYSWAEEGGLPKGEDAPAAYDNPAPNGPSMTYFPVPFFLSNKGYGVHLDTTYRTELHFGSEREDAWRAAVDAASFDATIYVGDPLEVIDAYTADTGRPLVPAQWVFGPRRRVGRGDLVDGVEEFRLMRQRHIPVTGVDDAVHFLPALSHLGIEQDLMTWTSDAHALGYKVMAYNNPYVAANNERSAVDYAYGRENGYFVKGPDGEPALTAFISGQLLEVAAVDLTNPDAVAWFQDLLRRTLEIGYDGWMHDFGEYTARTSLFADGRNGEEAHNLYPVLSAKAAHDLLEEERPGDYLFFVRSGYSGTQKYVPAVWGGDAEATFDETQGLPSSVRGGLNLSMVGVPLWGSDMTGFKCLTDAPNDKEVFLRWVEFGSVSPIMMEQNACSNPIEGGKEKWKLWNDEETIEHYTRYAGLHTRLQPYFLVLATEASRTGRPITMHPFLLHPDEPASLEVEDAYYLGPALYVSPVVRRGMTEKETWLPPGARYVDLADYAVYKGGDVVTVDAPLGKLPLFLVSEQILPLLDPSIETLAPADDPTVVDLDAVSDRLDVVVALSPGQTATLTLADGTILTATRGEDAGNPTDLEEATDAEIADCSDCFVTSDAGDVARLRASSASSETSELRAQDLVLSARGGPARRIRWDVLRLP
ncbi:MAG: glycoside hydrolase family 31 protein [Polyangiaceae bacterium]|nr:glycoside hydrolase family 31 protein [Polyangiaceae bacterium]